MRTRVVLGGLGVSALCFGLLVLRGVQAAPAPALSADVNQDGCVNNLDLDEIDLWDGEPVSPEHPILARLDLNHDGIVNDADFNVALDSYGECQ